MEAPKPGTLGTILFAYYQMGLQAFFMGLLFLLAGYFVPSAFDRKGAAKFLSDRFLRLGIPALLGLIAWRRNWLLQIPYAFVGIIVIVSATISRHL